jgi:hypothetical protein
MFRKRYTFNAVKRMANKHQIKIERRYTRGYDVWKNDDSIAECSTLVEAVIEINSMIWSPYMK